MNAACCVLVDDDDDSIREFIDMALGDEGYNVIGAADGVSALSAIREARPDLILLDMRMPDMDGGEFCRFYRQTPEPHAPIIVLTAACDAYDIGPPIMADGFLAKPCELGHLLNLVEKHLRRG